MIDFTLYSNEVPFVDILDFTATQVTEFLKSFGLVNSNTKYKKLSMQRYVYIYGDEKENYNYEEREHIKTFDEIFVYDDYYKKTNIGIIPCRVIAAELTSKDPLKSCAFFMKEINKAIGGFTIFFFKVNNIFHFGMRVFNKNNDDCTLSIPIITCNDMSIIYEKMLYISDSDMFINYYDSLLNTIKDDDDVCESYEEKVIEKRGVQYPYIKELYDVEREFGISTLHEKNQYCDSFKNNKNKNFYKIFAMICSELDFIKSIKANTMEMIFKADEMEQLAMNVENENEFLLSNSRENYIKEDLYLEQFLDDPEMLIKAIKRKKGI